MAPQNREIAYIFGEMADLLEIQGANRFRVRAYRNAERIISGHSEQFADMIARGEKLSRFPGIGKNIASKITEIVQSGTLSQYEKLKKRVPPSLIDLTRVAELGPKRISTLWKELGITSMAQLRQAARRQQIRNISGFGKKTEEKILREVRRLEDREDTRRYRLADAEVLVQPLLNYLKASDGVNNLEIAGSYRRRKESVGDIDILATVSADNNIMKRFVSFSDVDRILMEGETRSSIVVTGGLQVDLRVVPPESYGAALQYFTGSQAHNIALRTMAGKKGAKINEYGVFKSERRVAGGRENEIYSWLGLAWIPPELREDTGEIEDAANDTLPTLVTESEIRGDLHAHTRASDGMESLEEMRNAAGKRGYEYLAVTDHSRSLTIANGLSLDRLQQQMEEIDRLNQDGSEVALLKSAEVDIKRDGSLDLPEEVLEKLDLVVCSVHSAFELSAKRQTRRIIRAIENPHSHIIAHPTGRKVEGRSGYEVDLQQIMAAAAEHGCALEINAQPERLDLSDANARTAAKHGVLLSISTDAHASGHLEFMRYGVDQARRAGLSASHILNTKTLSDLKDTLSGS